MAEHLSYTTDELATFSNKLNHWARSLSVKERALLQILLDKASGNVEDSLSAEDLDGVVGGATLGTLTLGAKTFGALSNSGLNLSGPSGAMTTAGCGASGCCAWENATS